MEARAYIKYLKTSPKKLRFLVGEIKKMGPVKALDHLFYTHKRAAKFLYKAIKSALDNAEKVLKRDKNLFEFKLLTIEEGPRLKRFRAGGRGVAKPYKIKTAHIKIILTVKENEKKQSDNNEKLNKKLKNRAK